MRKLLLCNCLMSELLSHDISSFTLSLLMQTDRQVKLLRPYTLPWRPNSDTLLRKILLVSVKSSCPQFWGRKWLRQFYGRLEKCVLSAEKKTIFFHKNHRFSGGGDFCFLFFGGGKCRFYFYGRADFLILFISRDACSDSIAKLFRARFYGVSQNYRAICSKMGYRADVPS